MTIKQAQKSVNLVIPDTRSANYAGKTLIVRKSFYNPAIVTDATDRRFFCTGGFGASPTAIGRAVFGIFIEDGERTRVNRSDVEGLAVNEVSEQDAEKKAQIWDLSHPF